MKRLSLNTLLIISMMFAGIYALINGVNSKATVFAEPLAYAQQARLVSGSTATPFDEFSTALAMSGDTAVVYSTSGFFVFVRSDTTWSQQAVLVPSDGMSVAARAVDIDGDTIVIGGPGAQITSGVAQGAVYVFVRSGGTWTQQQRLFADDGAASDGFGGSVEIDGDTIVTGAQFDDVNANDDQGSAYVFVRNAGVWTQQSKIIANDGGAGHKFGYNVGIDGDTAVVSSRRETVEASVYVYVRTGVSWNLEQRLSNCEPSANSGTGCYFGSGVSISGDTIAAGNRALNVGSTNSLGGVYIYVRNAGAWTLQQRITDPNGEPGGGLGNSVSLMGNSLAVNTAAVVTPLAVYIYGRSGSTWSMLQPRLQFANQSTTGIDKKMVSISGNRFIFGVGRDITSPVRIGAAYIYWNGEADPTPTPTPTPVSTPTPTASPTPTPTPAQKTAFDYDADGRADLSVYRPSNNRWYLLRGPTDYLTEDYGVAGDIIAPADFDGDGRTEVAVFRPSNGTWYWLNVSTAVISVTQWGENGDIPVPADHDGDGKADLVLYRPSNGTWYKRLSTSNGSYGSTFVKSQFGTPEDKPLIGDFDGDTKADIAFFRPSNNNWYIQKTGEGLFVQTWGEAGDIPVPADYDGDGQTDVAIFRPSTGQWYRIKSTDGIDIVNWGVDGDKPTAADYDGDGKADISVFRPSNGTWYTVRSAAGIWIRQFGQTGDLPTENAYIH